ncbi:hypothetical protein Tco_0928370 [Tanacetum coccineum]
MHQLQQMQDKAKESCMISFRLLHSNLKALLNNDLKGTSIEGGFERAFATLFEQDVQTFTRTMFVNLDQLEKHLSKEEFQELESSSAFRVLLQQFQTFLYSRFSFDTDEGLMICKYFIANTKNDVLLFHDKLIQHMKSLQKSIQERAKHKREYDRRMNDRMMQSKEGKVDSSKALVAGLVVTESNETESERHPIAKVQLFAEHNIRANEQQHSEQSESVYDTYELEKVDRNTIPKSTDMCHRGGEIDQNADDEKCTLNLSAGTPFNPNKERLRVWLLKKLMSKNQVPQGIHKHEQSPNSAQCVNEQQQRAYFDDPCLELLHKVYISQGSSSNVHK